jgi:hypothetical protein
VRLITANRNYSSWSLRLWDSAAGSIIADYLQPQGVIS